MILLAELSTINIMVNNKTIAQLIFFLTFAFGSIIPASATTLLTTSEMIWTFPLYKAQTICSSRLLQSEEEEDETEEEEPDC